MAGPDAWETIRSRVAALIARREAVLDETAVAWARFARRQGWTRSDVECLWEGLTEDLVRRYAAATSAHTAEDVVTTMAALRTKIVAALEDPGADP